MPLFNYGRTPGYAPSGRGINPGTGKIGDMPGGMDFLAGLGPAPAGVTDWTDPAIINTKRLASPFGFNRGTSFNFAQALRSGQIGPESPIYAGFNPAQQALANSYRAAAFPQFFGPDSRLDMSPEHLGSLAQSAANAAPTTAQPMNVTLPSGRSATMPGAVPQVSLTGGASPVKPLAGLVGSMDQQWNDENDPGGFIRKWQGQQTGQPWTPNLGGSLYGVGKTTSMGG